ncbi:MAG: ABC transporter ATP-binding protein [Pyrinomonadaceae bacterium]
MAETVLEIRDLTKSFASRPGMLGRPKVKNIAVDNVSFAVSSAETLGIVGESGCGKSTLALTIMRLYEPDAGKIYFDGNDITRLNMRELKPVRRNMQLIFQDPLAAFDPRLRVDQIIGEPLEIHGVGTLRSNRDYAASLLRKVGLYAEDMHRLPSEFSGGQQQRIGIARALALKPRLLICDEPVSALDVSVQAQILNLLRDLQDELGFSYIFISHNIAITAFMSNRIGVMYLGKLVEIGETESIIRNPLHPYTEELLAAIPDPDPSYRDNNICSSSAPAELEGLSTGCVFRMRCPIAQEICAAEEPPLRTVHSGHQTACHFA